MFFYLLFKSKAVKNKSSEPNLLFYDISMYYVSMTKQTLLDRAFLILAQEHYWVMHFAYTHAQHAQHSLIIVGWGQKY